MPLGGLVVRFEEGLGQEASLALIGLRPFGPGAAFAFCTLRGRSHPFRAAPGRRRRTPASGWKLPFSAGYYLLNVEARS